MKSFQRAACTLFIFTLLASCASGFKANHDADPNQDFSRYETFSWIADDPMVTQGGSQMVNPLLKKHLQAELKSQMETRGYQFVSNPGEADFVLAYTVGSRDRIRVDSYPSGVYYGRRRGWGTMYVGNTVETHEYTEGVLAVDAFDTASKSPVWHGVAKKSIHSKDKKHSAQLAKSAVSAILEGFPSRVAVE